MSWGRNDDNMLEHLKWKMLEDDPRMWADAVALWSAARDYANRASTDGFIPESCLRTVTPMDKKRAKAVADALVAAKPPGYAAGLWERVEGGYQIHDFLKYNESRASKAAKADQERANAEQAEADRNAERVADAARKRAKRAESAGHKPDTSGQMSAGHPPDVPPDTARTSTGQSAGSPPDKVSRAHAPVPARARTHASAPTHAPTDAHARGPGPARPGPDEISQGSLDREQDPSVSVAMTRLQHGFSTRWRQKRDARGVPLGDMWPGFGKHAHRATQIAEAYADKLDALEESLDAFFASTKPIVAEARWTFGMYASDPGRWAREAGYRTPSTNHTPSSDAELDALFGPEE